MGKKPETRLIAATDLRPDPQNANAGTERGLRLLDDSLREHGAGRSILIDRNGVVLAGNKTLERAVGIGLDEVIVVQTDGRRLVAVQRTDLDLERDPAARALAYLDNRVAEVDLAWNPDQLLADAEKGIDLASLWHPEELEELLGAVNETATDFLDGEDTLSATDVPDSLFPTNNEWQIPLLDAERQADAVDLPVVTWGSVARTKRMKGTWHFYTGDDRFIELWVDPSPVVLSGCISAVEPDFSVYEQTPRAVALYRIFQKRWIARWWQSQGIRIFVDLNVAEPFAELNLLGVPHGWRAYATRGYTERMDATEREYELAQERAGSTDILFLVYGGGKAVAALCGERGWVHVDEHMNRVRREREAQNGEG